MWFNKENKINKKQFQKTSYAQCGEDLIMSFAIDQFKIEKLTYLDIGAHHPYYLSNTAFFYERGNRGICVEPDPSLFADIKKERPLDICLNIGVSDKSGESADFYVMNVPTLNTFSKEEAEKYASYEGKSIKEKIKVPLLTVNEIIDKYNGSVSPNIVSIDVEGLDYLIISSFDFKRFTPEIFCIETLSYTENKSEEKLNNIISFLESKGYFLYADTYINSIFMNKEKWKGR
jgi:FkbM family methyltransferase